MFKMCFKSAFYSFIQASTFEVRIIFLCSTNRSRVLINLLLCLSKNGDDLMTVDDWPSLLPSELKGEFTEPEQSVQSTLSVAIEKSDKQQLRGGCLCADGQPSSQQVLEYGR